MKRYFCVLFLVILPLGIANAQPVTWMDNYIDSVMETNHIPGAATLAFKNGQTIWTGYYGHANIANDVPVTDSTLFTMASISKTITATAVMQLCEDSLFNLDDDINDYLPFEVHNPWYPHTPITFRMLLAHTSTLDDNWAVINPLTVPGDSPIPLGEFLSSYFTPGEPYYYPSNFINASPGTNYSYVNIGVQLAAYLVELLNPDSLSFDQYCDEHIFAPLGMNETSWFLADLDTSHVATPYSWNGIAYQPLALIGSPQYPAVFLRTSAPQLARHLMAWGQFGQVDSVRILDSATVAEMRTPQIPLIYAPQCIIWFYMYFLGYWSYGHAGSMSGCRTTNGYCPAEDWGAIVLTNGESSAGQDSIFRRLFEYASGYTSLACNLTPTSTPIIIPPGGGNFDYSVEIENQTDSAAVFDLWTDITYPSGNVSDPIILQEDVSLPAFGFLTQQFTQNIAAGDSAGEYSYNAYVGSYPQYAWSLDYFAFTKESSQGVTPDPSSIISFALFPARPNPFNAATVIRCQLPVASNISLEVFDISGRKLVELASGFHLPGEYRYVWDAGNRAAGMYFVRLQAGEENLFEKLVLLK